MNGSSIPEPRMSVIIPNFNGRNTVGICIEAALASEYGNFEVIVVDDGSSDGSKDLIRGLPCKMVELDNHGGASVARNTGARASSGDILFFIDSDCLIAKDTIHRVMHTVMDNPGTVIGGTYTPMPYDKDFFSMFQSLFIHYFETKNPDSPDYVASHALAIRSDEFMAFPEGFLPIIEDVELSHRLRRSGMRLMISPDIQVRHVFGFSLFKSVRNAFRKAFWWTIYSIYNRDLTADSGTASVELKANVFYMLMSIAAVLAFLLTGITKVLVLVLFFQALNIYTSRRFILFIYKTRGAAFAVLSSIYYTTLYALTVGAGALIGGLLAPIYTRRLQRA